MPEPTSDTSSKLLRQKRDPTVGSAVGRMALGSGYFFEGVGFVFKRHPSLLKFCLIPLLINLMLCAAAFILLVYYRVELVNLVWQEPDSWILRILWLICYVFILMAVAMLIYLASFLIQSLLSAPFNDLLSEQVDLLAYGREPPPFSWHRLLRSTGRAVSHQLKKLLLFVGVMGPLILLNLVVPGIGTTILALGGFFLSARFLAYDHMDFSMARFELSFKEKRALLARHSATTFGFGATLVGLTMVPIFGLLCLPLAAAGGTLLFADIQAVEEGAAQALAAADSGREQSAPRMSESK